MREEGGAGVEKRVKLDLGKMMINRAIQFGLVLCWVYNSIC